MIKKLCTLLMVGLLAVPAMAQKECNKKCGAESFGPKKGQWQVNLVLGNYGGFYSENTSATLIPQYSNTQGSIGLPNGSSDQSGDLNGVLNIQGMNGHSLGSLGGVQIKYFFSDCWDLNVTMGLDLSATPKKDFVDGDYETVPDMIIPEQKYINAQVTNNWYITLGTERYFTTPNPRIQPYLGAAVGFQMARIAVSEPYTGKVYQSIYGDDDNDGLNSDLDPNSPSNPDYDGIAEGLPEHVYLANGKVGNMFGIKAAAVAGVEYSLAKGLILGIEFQPVSYRYDVIQICPRGFDKYNCDHHNFKVFDTPMVKLGFRF